MIGFPLVLPMGWMISPPMFTVATETVADLANHNLHTKLGSGSRRLDTISESPLPTATLPAPDISGTKHQPLHLPEPSVPTGRTQKAIKLWDVYVDDFMGMVQGNHAYHNRVKRVLLHALGKVFQKLDDRDAPTDRSRHQSKRC
jgi:hypothetical protein